MIRVRFAPSPTGYLHIGGVRTALFNFLYARGQEGKFLLRIEDTDQARSTKEFETEILESLEWLGLQWDEALVYQSERLERYQEVVRELQAKDLAYEEEKDGKKAVLFRMPKTKVVFHDLVHGKTEFDAALFDDLVIMKSDGFPTYHFAVVVDDHDMEISHIVRGDDHLSNTPRQILLYEALGWKPPKYAHLPLITGPDGSPLSKRHGAMAVSHYRGEGFLPEGLLNFLALLGWGSDNNQEIFDMTALIKKFSLKRVNKANAGFNMEKLLWINGQHLKNLEEQDYVKRITDYYSDEAAKLPESRWRQLVLLYRSRIKIFSDLKKQEPYLFGDIEAYDASIWEGLREKSVSLEVLETWLRSIPDEKFFEKHEALEAHTRDFAEAKGIKPAQLIHPLRFILTGKTVSPGLFELMAVLGGSVCRARIEGFVAKHSSGRS